METSIVAFITCINKDNICIYRNACICTSVKNFIYHKLC